MKCPFCNALDTKVVDSRHSDNGNLIRRRRECFVCKRRFTTHEIMETLPYVVIKRDKSRQRFERSKILDGLVRACEKRPISMTDLDAIVDTVEQFVQNAPSREISSQEIGEMVMQQLRPLDEVAYVRFASVYRQFQDISHFMKELSSFMDSKNEEEANAKPETENKEN